MHPGSTPKRYLSIVDGIAAMEGNGPVAGTRREAGILIGGSDPVAVDTVCARLMGFDENRLPLIARAYEPHPYPLFQGGREEIRPVSNVPGWNKPLQEWRSGGATGIQAPFWLDRNDRVEIGMSYTSGPLRSVYISLPYRGEGPHGEPLRMAATPSAVSRGVHEGHWRFSRSPSTGRMTGCTSIRSGNVMDSSVARSRTATTTGPVRRTPRRRPGEIMLSCPFLRRPKYISTNASSGGRTFRPLHTGGRIRAARREHHSTFPSVTKHSSVSMPTAPCTCRGEG